MSDDPLVRLRRLRREFGDVVAVRDVEFDVAKGAVLALVGPNGAGKTTLLRMLSAVLEPTAGTAEICGLDMREHPRGVHAKLGFLPDFFGLYEDLKVEEYLGYFARAYRIPEDAIPDRIGEVLDMVGLKGRSGTGIRTLSRGMRQRLGIGRTLIHDPPLLLLDEPASGLDPEARRDLQELFRELAKRGKTLVVSSHILSELEDYCSHVAILQEGALVVSGPVEEVRRSRGGGRRVRVRACAGIGKAVAVLEGAETVSALKTEGEEASFHFAGDDEALAGLLEKIAGSGARVVFFGEERRGIQESYLSWMGEEAE